VPGHRAELVTALIRSLPKSVRRRLVPIPERAAEVLAGISPSDGPLAAAVAARLAALTGEPVSALDLDLSRVPRHLVMRFEVSGSDGRVVAAGRDLVALQRRLADRARGALAAASPDGLERTGLKAWDMGALPRVVELDSGGHRVRAFPALVDEADAVGGSADGGGTVGVRVMATEADQSRAMAAGTRRLLLLAAPTARRDVERRLRAVPALAALPAGYPSPAGLAEDCLAAAADRIVSARGGPAWDAEGFAHLAEAARDRLGPLAVGAAGQAAELVVAAHGLDERLRATTAPVLQPAVEDMLAQVRRLVAPGFVARIGLARLRDVRRYLEGVRVRLDKVGSRPERDRDLTERVQALERAYAQAVEALPAERRTDPDVTDVRWLLEELRISFFAQTLGTSAPVSEPRLRRALAALTAD
jgi:ATP-dependent helicase HrpA